MAARLYAYKKLSVPLRCVCYAPCTTPPQPVQRGLARKRSSLAVPRYCSCSGANICAVRPVMNGFVNVNYAPSFRDIQPVHNGVSATGQYLSFARALESFA
jgi:hypothetical protein